MGGLHAGEAAGPLDGVPLDLGRQVVKLAARVGLPRHVLVLVEDADAAADGLGGSLE